MKSHINDDEHETSQQVSPQQLRVAAKRLNQIKKLISLRDRLYRAEDDITRIARAIDILADELLDNEVERRAIELGPDYVGDDIEDLAG